jgi:hypothetical protein
MPFPQEEASLSTPSRVDSWSHRSSHAGVARNGFTNTKILSQSSREQSKEESTERLACAPQELQSYMMFATNKILDTEEEDRILTGQNFDLK